MNFEPYVPYIIPGAVTLAGIVVVQFFAAHNRRQGNEEAKMPTVEQIWAREERKALQLDALHAAYARLRGAFSAYVHRVREGGELEPSPREKQLLTMSSTEAILPEEEEKPAVRQGNPD